jgi:hypothetical protein
LATGARSAIGDRVAIADVENVEETEPNQRLTALRARAANGEILQGIRLAVPLRMLSAHCSLFDRCTPLINSSYERVAPAAHCRWLDVSHVVTSRR